MNLSGSDRAGTGYPCKDLLFYGPSMQEVDFLDGLMLACKSRVLHEKGIRFDERFDFHFYDLDFCRQAEARGMRRWNLADFCGSRKQRQPEVGRLEGRLPEVSRQMAGLTRHAA